VDFTIHYVGNNVELRYDDTSPDPQTGVGVSRVSEGMYSIAFTGAANTTYSVEFTETLNPPNWQVIGMPMSDGSGNFELQHSSNGPRGYYRSRQP
jgi:hypothetical protein